MRTLCGSVDVDDGSGDIDTTDVGGEVTASSGPGEIYVRDVVHRDGLGMSTWTAFPGAKPECRALVYQTYGNTNSREYGKISNSDTWHASVQCAE